MAKLSQVKVEPVNQIVLAQNSPELRAKLAGKTLFEVGSEYELEDSDIQHATKTLTGGNVINNLVLIIEDKQVAIPMSRNFPIDKLNDVDFMLSCMFRESFKAVKDENGDPIVDANGKPVLDETAPYLTFGNPNALSFDTMEQAFTIKAAAKAGAKAGKS